MRDKTTMITAEKKLRKRRRFHLDMLTTTSQTNKLTNIEIAVTEQIPSVWENLWIFPDTMQGEKYGSSGEEKEHQYVSFIMNWTGSQRKQRIPH